MLLVTATSILTGPDILTVLLEYINLFQSQSQWQMGGDAYSWPHTSLPHIYLSPTNYLSIFCSNLFLLAMLRILVLLYLSIIIFYSKIGLSLPLNYIVQPYLILLDTVCMCGIWNLNPQLKIIIPSIASFIARTGFVHSAFSYLLFGIPNRSAIDFMFVVVEIPTSFLYYAGNFFYDAGIMLYTFQPLLCLKLCRRNWFKPSGHREYRVPSPLLKGPHELLVQVKMAQVNPLGVEQPT